VDGGCTISGSYRYYNASQKINTRKINTQPDAIGNSSLEIGAAQLPKLQAEIIYYPDVRMLKIIVHRSIYIAMIARIDDSHAT